MKWSFCGDQIDPLHVWQNFTVKGKKSGLWILNLNILGKYFSLPAELLEFLTEGAARHI